MSYGEEVEAEVTMTRGRTSYLAILRKLADYIAKDFKQIAFPASIPNKPGFVTPTNYSWTLRRRLVVLGETTPERNSGLCSLLETHIP